MREIAKKEKLIEKFKTDELASTFFKHLAAAALSFTASRGTVLDAMMPFGISAVAGCGPEYLPAVATGVFLGYFFPAIGAGGFRYIAAMLAVLAIRLMLSGFKSVSKNTIFLSGISLLSVWLTAAVTLIGLPQSIFNWLSEGLLTAVGTYFIHKACKAVSRNDAGLMTEDLTAELFSIGIILLGCYQIAPFGVSLGRVGGIFLILAAAKYGGIAAGAISGIAVSVFSLLNNPQGDTTLFALGGAFAGVFAPYGKYAQTAAVAVCAIIGTAISGDLESLGALLAELILGGSLFIFLPRSLGATINRTFSLYPKTAIPENMKKAVKIRLEMASSALRDVSSTVEQVSRELSRINSPDFGSVMTGVEQEACRGCKLRIHCWESRKEQTLDAILKITDSVKHGAENPVAAAPEEFKGRCLKSISFSECVKKKYSEFASLTAAENRVEEVRTVVSSQFDGIADMLLTLADDFENENRFDAASAERAAAALQGLDIRIDECSGLIDKYGRLSLQFKIKRGDAVLNRMQIMRAVSLACERDFDPPLIREAAGDIFITLNEHAPYRVDLGVNQISAGKSDMCGDACLCFNDGKGHFIMVLSDGMGTGGRAAVDGAMASGLMSRLLKSGFGYDCSLKILNSAMLFKSSDESLATVDIASLDLFTGEAELYKAGAAPTLVKRNGRTGRAVSTSLPIGILSDVSFDRAGIRLRPKDILLLLSDGATSEGTEWIRNELENWSGGTAQELAEHISECARRRNTEAREDDITVMAAILEKAV